MSSEADQDWKKKLGFTINFESDDDFDTSDVVMRHPVKSSRFLLADNGDGAEADILGTTPPRTKIRDKGKRRSLYDGDFALKLGKDKRLSDTSSDHPNTPERRRRGCVSKLGRMLARDYKQEMGERDSRADSLPSPNVAPAVPSLVSLVDTCSRFMSLTSSRLKCREAQKPCEDVEGRREEEVPPSRVHFHDTFSMLINMGNVDKGCRRTISREEQVWQNELKDLIWLELQAKVAGRTLAQQDAYLCAQRDGVPKLLQAIMEYKFVNPSPCKANSNRGSLTESIRSDASEGFDDSFSDNENESRGCISLDCVSCARAVSRAAQELGGLLERYHAALSLYPSGSALVADQPVAASARFDDRIKAMCLWYNTALHVRLKMLAVRRMLRSLQCRRSEREDPLSRQSSDSSRPCQVRFNICTNPSDSNDSDGSTQSQKDDKNDDSKPNDDANGDSKANDVSIDDDSKANDDPKPNYDDTDDDSKAGDDSKRIYDDANDDPKAEDSNNVKTETNDGNPQDESEHEETYREVYDAEVREADNETEDKGDNQEDETEANTKKKDADDVDSASDRYDTELSTPEIVISEKDSKYSTVDSSASGESGYASEADVGADALRDLTRLRLLDKCSVSPYRIYHDEILKTQGVRRCMMFVNKMRSHVLHRVFLTIEKPDSDPPTPRTEQEAGVFEEAREDEREDEPERHEQDELKRYGCWSAESLSMCLPSYRNHLLLLSCICLEAVHDYLAMRLEDRPEKPSCLTVKQLIHDLREGLDIGADMRFSFVRNVQAAVTGWGADRRARSDLQLVLHTYDTTLDTVLQQYLSYLTTMSVTEQLGRSCLQAEWAFVARLARRVAAVAARAPAAFCDITCNQIDRLKIQFREKFNMLRDFGKKTPESKRQEVYQLCRSVQTIFTSEREAILQTAQWSRALAARLAPKHHRERNRLLNSLMELRDCIVEHTEKTLEHSRTDSSQLAFLVTDGIVSRVRELLLQVYRLGFEIHKELHRFVNEQVSGRASQRIDAVSLSPAKERRTFARSQSIVEDFENNDGDDSLFRHLEEGYNKTVPSTVPAPEDSSTAAELQRGWQRRVALAVVAFAECWMHFVLKRCERGRGLRPRWASQGLEFLMLACDPCNTKHLTDAKFEELKTLMDSCISHVIGSRAAPRQNSDSQPRHTHRMQSPLPNGGVSPQPTTTDPEYQHIKQHIGKLYDHSHRVAKATKALDLARDQQLREMKAVGRVLEASVTSYEPKLRQLTFKWQRGLKIGAGSFGKVYTVVNTESGQVLAMKEISVGAGDRRGVQRAANELRVLEGVIHPHLVRYYGCELHREELLLFMELCVEGALDTLVASTGALAEHTTRRYTRQLLSAVRELHARGIVHRDIKSGNIFLTNDGHCLKLGDFGCAVKIRANTTAHGELQGFVGTQAYMAPEVFMNSKTSGHGRAADIWSVGCVVTEMASGKRPFSEYDSNYQIMFVVGMGGRPAVPAALSAEGAAFCRACLTHDPATRPRAAQLLNHHFLMVKSDDDCKCEAGFLL